MKSNNPAKKTIINIDPINGVTPNQLFDQCQYLVKTLKESYQLNEEEIQESINDTVIAIYKMMESGKVPKFSYEDFKGYLFISLKRQLIHRHNQRKGVRNLFHSKHAELQPTFEDAFIDESNYFETNEAYQTSLTKEELISKAISSLSEQDKLLIEDSLSSRFLKPLLRKHKVTMFGYQNVIQKMKDFIKEQLQASAYSIPDFDIKTLNRLRVKPEAKPTLKERYCSMLKQLETENDNEPFYLQKEVLKIYTIQQKKLNRLIDTGVLKVYKLNERFNFFMKKDIHSLNLKKKMTHGTSTISTG
ncbi:MAG: sigma-70 family RNA polymerase sigma factor [Flavobacterium sp.]|nr:MAG: sigma-70 family RNA polymerase sigma factor [Flavobacterium sp.]